MKNILCCKSPIGKVIIVEEEDTIVGLYFRMEDIKDTRDIKEVETMLLKRAKEQIHEYFKGERKAFDLPFKLQGTEFQKKVWKVLCNIPYGETLSYKDVAKSIGNENASRAVGNANNKNPLPIFIPCHRVIGSDRSLVGYGGGLDIKIKLLELERKNKWYLKGAILYSSFFI